MIQGDLVVVILVHYLVEAGVDGAQGVGPYNQSKYSWITTNSNEMEKVPLEIKVLTKYQQSKH